MTTVKGVIAVSKIGIVFDIDGVLIDSYRGVPIFYRKELPSLIGVDPDYAEYLLYMEYLGEALGLLREDWWFSEIPGLDSNTYDKLITRYWEIRIEHSRPAPGVPEVLDYLRSMGYSLYSVSYRDDIYGLKRYRIEAMGLANYFEDIIIAGEDVNSRTAGIENIMRDYNLDLLIYVDDKALNLYKIRRELSQNLIDKIVLVHHGFHYEPFYPWFNPGKLFKTINSLHELVFLIGEQHGVF